MKIELIATGDEITTGSIVDTNSAVLASRLTLLGHRVTRIIAFGDDLKGIVEILKESATRADAVICAGGLGPTSDDLTTEAAGIAAGVPLELNEAAWENIKSFFSRINLPLAVNNKKQALLPQGSDMLDNPIGTAPGYMIRIGGTPCFFAPGVPRELFRMFEEQILPRLAKLDATPKIYLTRVWRTFGFSESGLGELLGHIAERDENLRLSFRANFPEIRVGLSSRGNTKEEAEKLLEANAREVEEKISTWTFSRDGRGLQEIVGDQLRKKKWKLALAESCTGGLIGKMITEAAGSSDFFVGGVVAYHNPVKINLLKVDRDLIEKHGAVSEECARAMASGARSALGADVGLSVTGIAGPSGGTPEKPVGTVYMACATPTRVEVRGGAWPRGDREQIRLISAYAALDLLRKTMLQE